VKEKRINIPSFDGYTLEGKLALPKGEDEVSKLVVFVTGTGPSTYENRDIVDGMDVNMFDGFSNEFSKRGIAYFMHSQRGIHVNDRLGV